MLNLSSPELCARRPGLYPFVLFKGETETHWDTLEPFIDSSVRHSRGMITTAAMQRMLMTGDAVVIGTAINMEMQAVTVCTVVEYTTYKACRILAAAGKNLREAMTFFHIIEGWALHCGCSEVEAWCRPSVSRLLRRYRWKQTYEMLTIDLRSKLQ